MEFRSCYKYARISPRKARYVIDLIRGKSVNDALRILRVTHKRASYMIDKVLRAAIATANENLDVDVDSLCVTQALVDCAPTRKWQRCRPRGMSVPILKRSSHITVVLSKKSKGIKVNSINSK
ncbi:MAG: 50S ribosomal protein L22 [Planctomycetes bacterium GWF2_39_10]|nr:MAG: 50S ribosomal protein L22 [Planctomycetes bacterium GWA2_39_15]OHB42730.1 MAG: 50S ribosomal protein L22 [Planctomycetes bacterium GWC2_39_26]OHB48762.1 MAG: 50S ribosomal protein L22 [Planctomycetes bacterium GWF2_39_10]OHC00742.1 MAG: 50S ribosomal protein L22 [Planctomycetes bacterium RIFCSPLOWO2_12_FULL_39_13]